MGGSAAPSRPASARPPPASSSVSVSAASAGTGVDKFKAEAECLELAAQLLTRLAASVALPAATGAAAPPTPAEHEAHARVHVALSRVRAAQWRGAQALELVQGAMRTFGRQLAGESRAGSSASPHRGGGGGGGGGQRSLPGSAGQSLNLGKAGDHGGAGRHLQAGGRAQMSVLWRKVGGEVSREDLAAARPVLSATYWLECRALEAR